MAHGPQVCDCKRYWLWVRSPLEEIKYLFKSILPHLRSHVQAGVECLATQQASKQNSTESDERSVLTLSPL